MLAEFLSTGRLGRGAFWLRHLTTIPLALGLTIAATDGLGRPLDLLVALVLLLLLISTWGRRLHDRGRSAWWLLAALVPVLGPLCLIVECGFRKTSPRASNFGATQAERADYLTV